MSTKDQKEIVKSPLYLEFGNLKISKRYSQPNLSYWRKTNRGAFGPPPIRSRVNWWLVIHTNGS